MDEALSLHDSGLNEPDWRSTAVKLLIRHDEEWAAEQLATLVCAQPSRQLLDMTDGLFVRYRRYETAPIYLRYALLEGARPSIFATIGMYRYKLALEELGVPQVAIAWLYHEASAQSLRSAIKARESGERVEIQVEALVLRDSLRRRLERLMGDDAGRLMADWEELYDARIATAPSPLPEPLRKEADRVVACFKKYVLARSDLLDALRRGESMPASEIDEPNWDVPTIEALEREISVYVERVRRRRD